MSQPPHEEQPEEEQRHAGGYPYAPQPRNAPQPWNAPDAESQEGDRPGQAASGSTAYGTGGYPAAGGYRAPGYQAPGYQAPGYPAAGYLGPEYSGSGYAGHPPRPGSPEQAATRTQAIVSLVLNVVSVLFCCNLLGIAGAVLAGVGLGRVETDLPQARNLLRWSWVLLGGGIALVVLGAIALLGFSAIAPAGF